jgi:hypothetical protein
MAAGMPLASWLDPRRLSRTAQILVAAMVAYAALSLLWTPVQLSGMNDFCWLVLFAGAVLLGANIEDLDSVLRAMGWGVAVSSAFAIGQLLGWHPVAEFAGPAGLFFNGDFLAEIAAVLFVYAFYVEALPLVIALSIPLAFCGSRVALLSAGLGLLVSRREIAFWGVGALVMAAGFATLWASKGASAAARFDIWYTTAAGITIFGHGIGSFVTTYPSWERAHSDFLQSLYEMGIGALPLVALFGLAARWADTIPVKAALVCIGAQYLTAFPLHLPATAFLAGVLVGNVVRVRDGVCHIGYASRVYAG